MSTYADATRARATELTHEWDRRAIDWPLTRDSVVIEVGGYTGRWALQIAERYQPQLYVFEPQPWAAATCMAVLGKRAHIFGCALGDTDGEFPMGDWETDGCSLVKPGDNRVFMREIGRLFAAHIPAHIDLMLMNIEGYEFTLLPHMLDIGLLPERLMVQWHMFGGTMQQYRDITDRIEQTHDRVWDYGDVLQAWVKR